VASAAGTVASPSRSATVIGLSVVRSTIVRTPGENWKWFRGRRAWPGVPIGDEEGRLISEGLGDKQAILLAHYGLLTACTTLEEATNLAFYMERAAKLQLMARSVGPIKAMKREHALEARAYRGGPKYVGATFNYLARNVIRDAPEVLD
jgi:L-fuculose-phosphate aldolase